MIDIVLNVLLACAIIAMLVSVWRFHRSGQYEEFNLLDLITSRCGKISRPAIMELGAFVLMTWGFVMLINASQLTEWYTGIYVGAFVLRAAYSSYLAKNVEKERKPVDPKEVNA